MPLNIIKGNIVDMDVDAVVSPTNTRLFSRGRHSVDAQIKRAAGPELAPALEKLGRCPVGSAVITDGFNMKCRYIIHTVGPVWSHGYSGEDIALSSCYTSCLKLAEENGCSSVAFPLISSGNYGFPPVESLRIARESIAGYLESSDSDMTVTLVVHDRSEFMIDPDIKGRIDAYLNRNCIPGDAAADGSAVPKKTALSRPSGRRPGQEPGSAGNGRVSRRLDDSRPVPRFSPKRREDFEREVPGKQA